MEKIEEIGERLFEKVDVTRYEVKKLMVVPLVLLLIALAILGYTQMSVGSPVSMGMDFRGGTMVKIPTERSTDALRAEFGDLPLVLVGKTGIGNEKRLEFDMSSESQEYHELLDRLEEQYSGRYEIKSISPIFGKRYQHQALLALIIAFSLMAIVVFVVFRTFVPSFAVVLSAFSDIVIAAACMDIIGMKLSLGTVAALLMLIGYSVDSDILLTTNLLRKKGELVDNLRGAMKTGLMMTSTTILAIFAMFIVSFVIDIDILKDIAIVLLFGLAMDVMNTWMLNAGILRWYIESREAKRAAYKKLRHGKGMDVGVDKGRSRGKSKGSKGR